MGLRQFLFGIKQFLFRKAVEQKVKKDVKKDLGSKSLSYNARIIRGLISVAGVTVIRKRVISGIESDLKRFVKKDKQATVKSLIKDAVNTPDYMTLLKDLDMNKSHLQALAQEALENANRT